MLGGGEGLKRFVDHARVAVAGARRLESPTHRFCHICGLIVDEGAKRCLRLKSTELA